MRLFGVVALLASSSAHAFVCTQSPEGTSLAWDHREVQMRRAGEAQNIDAAAIDGVIDVSASSWNDVDCSDFALARGAPADDRKAEFDWAAGADSAQNENVVVFRTDDPNDPVDLWLHSFSALAITTVTFVATSGRILDADVEFNAAAFTFSACTPGPGCSANFDLQNTLTHEMGHVLGLDHPPPSDPGAQDATMFASAAEGDLEKRTLAADDIQGLCTLYPTGQPAGACYDDHPPRAPPPVVFTRAVCGQGGQCAPPAVALLLLWAVRRGVRGRPRS